MTPIRGIYFGTLDYRVESISKTSPVVWVPVDFITIVPNILGEISFYSCEPQSMYEASGDNTTIFLNAGNNLNIGDNSALIFIQNSVYEIQFISNGTIKYQPNNNLIPITPAYSGTIVSEGLPLTELYTSPIRPAFYYSGNYTSKIRFAYQVRRGDSGIGVQIANPIQSPFISSNPYLNGGHLYRLSMNPSLEANSVISSYPSVDSKIRIDTSSPYITKVSTTSPPGTYSAGDEVDFEVTFNFPVSVRNGTYGGPSLFLAINPYSYVVAQYLAGSESKTLVFGYSVISYIYSDQLSANIITTSYPVIQPLRAISNNLPGFIRRTSAAPLIDANLSFTQNGSWNPFWGISMIGMAPKVVSLACNNISERGDNLTAGDVVFVSIKFSQSINVSYNGSKPYILLDLGRTLPGNASFFQQSESDTLVFSYQITTTDSSSNGLYLYCTCIDFFNRSFISLQGSRIFASWNSSIDASIIIAPNSSLSARLINPFFLIDNTPPSVIQLATNVSNSLYSPGTSILISVQFTRRILVYGYVTLAVRGDNTACSARYYSGNGSDILRFLYLTNEESGTCRLDCQNATSLDTSKGAIVRYSNYPQIPAHTRLPYPGMKMSLGVVTDIIIDPSPSQIITINSSVSTVLPMASVVVSTSDFYKTIIAYRFAQENSTIAFNASTTVEVINMLISESFVEPVLTLKLTSYSVSFYDPNNNPFLFLPLFITSTTTPFVPYIQSQWWSAYSTQSSFDVSTYFDRAVDAPGSWIAVGHDKWLNQAKLTNYSTLYNLTIFKVSGVDLMAYQLEYKGFLTRCISCLASAQGIYSIESALNEISVVQLLGVIVSFLEESDVSVIYQIMFLKTPTAVLQVRLDTGNCKNFVPANQIILDRGKHLSYRYSIRDIDSIVLTPNQFIQPGLYELILSIEIGIKLSPMGVEPNSVRYEHHNTDTLTSTRENIPNRGVARVVYSYLNLGTSIPNATTSLELSICLGSHINAGDYFLISLPDFKGIAFSIKLAALSATWFPSNATLIVNITTGGAFCMELPIDASYGLITSSSGLYENSPSCNFTYFGADSGLYQSPFSVVSAVGMIYSILVLDNPIYLAPTRMEITFALASEFIAQDGLIILRLPGFTSFHLTDLQFSVTGDFEYMFNAFWDQKAEELQISSVFNLLPGGYSLIIPNFLQVSSTGISPENPPTFRVQSNTWTMSPTEVLSFPTPVGILESSLRLEVFRPSLIVTSIYLFVNFTRVLAGPGNFSVYLPVIWSTNGSLNMNFSQSEQMPWIWRNDMKLLTFYVNNSWSNQMIVLSFSNLTGLTLHESDNVTMLDSKIEFYGADGFLLPSSIGMIQPINCILKSSILFNSVLFSHNSSVEVTARLNHFAYPGLKGK